MSITRIRPTRTQKVSFTGTAASSSSIGTGSGTIPVRLHCTEDCHIAFGTSPTATADDMPLKAGQPEYFEVNAGSKISAIQDSSGGDLFITEGVGY